MTAATLPHYWLAIGGIVLGTIVVATWHVRSLPDDRSTAINKTHFKPVP